MQNYPAIALSAAILIASGAVVAQTTTPGTAQTTPGTAETTPGTAAQTAPGTAQTTPGMTGTTPGTAETTPGTAMDAAQFDEATIEMALSQAGYTEVSDLSIDDDKFTATAMRDGNSYEIEGMRSSDKASEVGEATEEQITERLEERGYENISNLERTGNSASAEATKDGDEVKLHVDMDRNILWQAKEGS